jgi:hypothetical protein
MRRMKRGLRGFRRSMPLFRFIHPDSKIVQSFWGEGSVIFPISSGGRKASAERDLENRVNCPRIENEHRVETSPPWIALPVDKNGIARSQGER